MKLSTVRALKAELKSVETEVRPLVRAYSVREAERSPRVSARKQQPAMAMGASPHPERRNDFQLAVRAYRGQSRRAREILRASSLGDAMGEVDWREGIRYETRGLSLQAGGSCGHYNITAGTLGAFVEDDEYYYILSNNHVLADSDRGVEGDPILQPGPVDIVRNYNSIAELSRWVPLGSGSVDAAIAAFADDVDEFYPHSYVGIGDIDPRPMDDRFEVQRVSKRGRTTRTTRGTVSAFELDGVQINYGSATRPRWITFNDQMEFVGAPPTRPFSQPGDSGSLIVDRDTLRPVALLYGGGEDADGIDRTLGHFIGDVLDELGVRFVE